MHDVIAVLYLVFFGLFLPYASLKSVLWKKGPAKLPLEKNKLRVTVIVNLVLFGVMSFVAAADLGIDLLSPWQPKPLELVAILAVLIVWLVARWALLPWLREGRPEKGLRLLPETWADLPMWALISLCAGFFEEVVYRGLLYGLLVYYTHSLTIAATLSATAFALAHMRQGWRSVAFIFLLALSFQRLVVWTNTLYPAMIAHALYDFIVGIWVIKEKQSNPDLELMVDC